MKEKRIVLMGLAILAMFVFFTLPASAAPGWRECEVVSVETDDQGVVTVTLMRIANGSIKSFEVPVGEENRMLAIAMTAMTNQMDVRVYLDWAVPGSLIERLLSWRSDRRKGLFGRTEGSSPQG